MNPASALALKGTVVTRSDAAGRLTAPGDAVIIERGRPRWLLLACPCGCGDEIPINLDPRAGKAWRLYSNKRHGTSLYPSVWRDTNCGSHFIIWRDSILLFRGDDEAFHSPAHLEEIAQLSLVVNERIPAHGFIAYVDIADSLEEVPWDVLDACKYLVRGGILREGAGDKRGAFSRIEK